ncbi:hypothetical protein AK830_g12174 [Neonectria ditissima]|uniref:Uncharacterized protein n=1 Tax=Neonectria ditissima TaxID=78410 RepID=A0A0P7B3U4_9HYPO|nr:hypothetical protein AK830_g12174 [Neonectria ditissima]
MPDDFRRFCWPVVLHCAEVLPAGLLWATGIALSVPQSQSIEIVIVVLLIMSSAVTTLAHKPILKAANFGGVAIILAFYFIAHGVISRTHAIKHGIEPPLIEDVGSCLREYAVVMALICSAMAMACPNPPRTGLPLDPLQVERPNPFAPDASLFPNGDLGSKKSWDFELFSNAGSLPFRHFGPTSHYSGSSENSMTLSSSGDQADPVLVMTLDQLSMKMNSMVSAQDDASTEPQSHFVE